MDSEILSYIRLSVAHPWDHSSIFFDKKFQEVD